MPFSTAFRTIPFLLKLVDSLHKAYNVMDWLERHSIEVVDHPPYSPDLNPIEPLWVELKK